MTRSEKELRQQLEQLQEFIPFGKIINRNISHASVGWHISHCLKVCTTVFDALAGSDTLEYRKEFSLPRTLVLLSGYIPRGKAGAPKKVLPEEHANSDHIDTQVREVRQKWKISENSRGMPILNILISEKCPKIRPPGFW